MQLNFVVLKEIKNQIIHIDSINWKMCVALDLNLDKENASNKWIPSKAYA